MENEAGNLDLSSWNGRSALDNSEWLAENIKGIDQSVAEMLQLVEDDTDSVAERVDGSDHLKQHEVVARIKEICHRHHLLAHHYNKLTEELSSQSKLAKENEEERAFDSQLTPPFLTPMNKPRMQKDAGSDLSSGGGISDITPNRGSESSLSSDSESETYFMSPNERLSSAPSEKMVKRGIVDMGIVEISDYEKELDVCKGKLSSAEEEIVRLKMERQNNDTVMVKLGSLEAELLAAKNHIKLYESEMEKDNERSLMLQREIVDLEAELLSAKNHIKLHESEMEKESEKSLMMQRKIVDLEAKHELERKEQVHELSGRDNRIQKLCAELQDASGSFALEKWQLESTVSKLSEKLSFQEVKTEELQAQCGSLADEKDRIEADKVELGINLEALKITWQDDIERLMVELSEKNTLVDTLNQNLDEMELKYNMVMAERDGVNAKLEPLEAEISCLKQNLNVLHSEKKRLSALSESGNKITGELKSKVVELEQEVGILGEQKRAAIRQLCFAIDHFRCAYEDLKSAPYVRKGALGAF